MALETNDILTLKSLMGDGHNGGMSSYEQFKVGHMQSRRASGVAIGGLATGIAAAAVAVGVGFYANSKANSAKEVAIAKNDGLKDLVTLMAQNLAAERAERITGDTTISQTVTDTLSGSQQGTLTAQQQSELSALQSVTNTVTAGLMTGQYSQNPLRVVRVSGQRECGCDSCNG